jgi:hypothetical protein
MPAREARQNNIDNNLLAAHRDSGAWTPAAAQAAARRIAAERSVVDWDDGAGEGWIRLLAGTAVEAYVSVAVPLLIAASSAGIPEELRPVLQTILVEDLDSPELCATVNVLEAVFGASGRIADLDPAAFSANDLWYATV